jgi:hypothetical protein
MTKPDLSEFVSLSNPKRRSCRVCTARENLAPDDRAAVDAALAHDKHHINSGAIAKWFAKRGHEVNASAVAHHRAGTCRHG